MEEKGKEAWSGLTRAQNGVVATRLVTPTGAGSRGSPGQSKGGVSRKSKEDKNTSECDASARAQAELDKAIDDVSRAVLGGKPSVEHKCDPVSLAAVPRVKDFGSFQRAFPPQAEGFSAEC